MAEYIWSAARGGDARTSTFVFRRKAIRAILFDPELRKHQDWDLAIRFADHFRLLPRAQPTVMVHKDVENRMSATMNHEGTQRFLARHLDRLSDTTTARFYTALAYGSFQIEGRSRQFRAYVGQALGLFRAARPIDQITMVALRIPFVDRLYIWFREWLLNPLLAWFVVPRRFNSKGTMMALVPWLPVRFTDVGGLIQVVGFSLPRVGPTWCCTSWEPH